MYKSLLVLFTLAALLACTDITISNVNSQNTAQKTKLTIYKRESCGCCNSWITHLDKNHFDTQALNDEKLTQFKLNKDIKPRYHSCHTAVSQDGFVFEGHIPAKYIQQFLKNKPEDVIGLAVPAMPIGSPGMEMGNRFSPYQVLLLKKGGSYSVFAQVSSQKEQY
ncbi:DUF411 domain-containing protein [Pseudoalteromonas denitrificans]|uniref:Uncharacterized conserved protein n=1 Tax=Pseudoalteromonas denitrificans DSM 6059 TaxID=1123010 RepID=A0A1I1IQ96_9GAMM|nr:DUF411 domain-containing protein [Pseudoalteromonas denitrificans]SFC38404.1 Uncharacterized conserved protein [Pseudoalteromonas denitrificans DSM 6059]